MNLYDWLPPITTTAVFAIVLWLCRKLIETRLTKSVQHEFNTKLETLRADFRREEELLKADLRAKDRDIAVLRDGAMTAMASRQIALDKRRLEAVDQLWSAMSALARTKGISMFMAMFKSEEVLKEVARSPQARELFAGIGAGLDPNELASSSVETAAKARPFVSPMAWALFSAYQAIAIQGVLRLQTIKAGVGKDFTDKQAVAYLIKAALPDRAEYIDKYGAAAYRYLLDELEQRLLEEFQNMLAGREEDKASVEKAAEILKASNKIIDSAKESAVATPVKSP
jgi:hypothetical protein